MILSKTTILELMKGECPLIENLIDQNMQIKENGVELTIGNVFTPKESGIIDFDNTIRYVCQYETIYPITINIKIRDDTEKSIVGYQLKEGTYIVKLHEKVNIPKNMIALIRGRSSLFRNGVTVKSGVWDSGYSGRGSITMTVENPHGVILTKDARICQMYFAMTDKETDGYRGIYQGE